MRIGSRLLLGSLGSLAVLALASYEGGRISPGSLSAVHAALPDLAGPRGCAACHGRGTLGMIGACTECHESIWRELRAGAGLHATFVEPEVDRCGGCHVEHAGTGADLLGARSFAATGVLRREDFRHDRLGFELEGSHGELACKACHPQADSHPLPRGSTRYGGLSQDCRQCHDDAHAGRLGRDCAACHGQEKPFELVALHEHARSFPLEGVHASLACRRCHPNETMRSVEELERAAALGPGFTARQRRCRDCHANPHDGESALRLGTGADCARCHDSRAFVPIRFDRVAHARLGVELEGAHARATCVSCHSALREPFGPVETVGERRTPLMQRCKHCHGNPHQPPLTGTDRGSLWLARSENCEDCHDAEGFQRLLLTATDHDEFAFGLVGGHRDLACRQCHGSRNAAPVWERVAVDARHRFGYDSPRPRRQEDCLGCHFSPHGKVFLAGVAARSGVKPAESCVLCHEADDGGFIYPWVAFDKRLHAAAGFPLVGPHATRGCGECHEGFRRRGPVHEVEELVAAFGRLFPGRKPEDCGACHEDPHEGQFGGGPFADGKGGGRCLACHDEARFRPPAFAHEAHEKTRFPLSGSHAALACSRCHERATADGPRRFSGTTRACEACHDDVHDARFDAPGLPLVVAGRRGCARCHTSERFGGVRASLGGVEVCGKSFDHGRWTGFALAGKHATADCADCHGRRATERIGERSLGKAEPGCASCHGEPHAGQFAVAGTTECTRCHESGTSFDALVFDHARDARFPLDHGHDALACDACHRPFALPSGSTIRRYKPLPRKCAGCHDSRTVGSAEASKK